MPSLESLLVTLIVTTVRCLVDNSATLLAGVFLAAGLRTHGAAGKVADWFSGSGAKGVLRASLLGALVPVCAVGVLPVLRELQRNGVATSKLLAFGLAAPLVNPFALIFGLSALRQSHLSLVIVGAVSLAFVAHHVSARWAVVRRAAPPDVRGRANAIRMRLRNMLVATGRIATGWFAFDILFAILLSGVTAACLAPGQFEEYCSRETIAGPLRASLWSLTQYVNPLTGIMQLAAVNHASLSFSTALAVYLSGVGVSGASLVWLIRNYGTKRSFSLLVPTVLMTVGVCYASRLALPLPAVAEEGTHALDTLTRPYNATFAQLGGTITSSLQYVPFPMKLGVVALGLVALWGVVVRSRKLEVQEPDAEDEASADEMTPPSRGGSRNLTPGQIAGVSLCGIGAAVMFLMYLYLPSPREVLDEMRSIQADLIVLANQSNRPAALEKIAQFDTLTAKLPLCAALRLQIPGASEREATRAIRVRLADLRSELEAADLESNAGFQSGLPNLLTACRKQYLGANFE